MPSFISKIKQPHALLNHILDQPDLPDIIRNLDSGVLTRLIHHVGLEDAGQIVSLASATQLKGIFDEDLWHSKAPGQTEVFDAERFGVWLEVMMESGPEFAAQKVMELDEDLVTLGLCRLVLVVDISDMAIRFSDEWQPVRDNLLERVMDSALNKNFDNFIVLSKNLSHWDTVCAILAELNQLDDERLTRILERCRKIAIETMEDNEGFINVLSGDEMLEEDVAADREERREGKGFVTSTSAAVFLSKIRSTPLKKIIQNQKMDFATRVYLESAAPVPVVDTASERDGAPEKIEERELVNLKVAAFIQTLQAADVLPSSDQKLLGYDDAGSGEHHLPLVNAMAHIGRTDPALYDDLMTEFSYLSNTLVSGCTFKRQKFTATQAAEAAFSVCNLGCEILLKTDFDPEDKLPVKAMTALLEEHRLVKLFQAGWKILFDNVVVYSAKSVFAFLNTLKARQMDLQQVHEVRQMARFLHTCITSGRPWEFDDPMDHLLIFLDGETVSALSALVQEYPTLSDVICHQGRHRVSPFVWSKTHIRTVRKYLSKALNSK